MRVVLDTNVIISALNFPGNERIVLELALRGRFEFYLSLFILKEVAGVLGRKFGWDEERTAQAVLVIENAATVIDPPRLPEVIGGGHADNRVLECAVAAATVKEIFESSRRGNGLKEICKELNGRGITNKGRRWQKNVVHYLLTNDAYTGTAVWGLKSKGDKAEEPVRVEGAWPALVSRETFDVVQQGLHDRAPAKQRPARVGSQYLLSGLLRCGVCGKPYSGQGAKSGQFAYYVCASLFREGAGACTARYLNAAKVEDLVIEKVRERILTEETITELVTLVAEEIDNLAGEVHGRLTAINSELSDVETRLENLYQALETKQLPIEALSPHPVPEEPPGPANGGQGGGQGPVGAAAGRSCPRRRKSKGTWPTSVSSCRKGRSRSGRPSSATSCRALKSWTTRRC